MKQKIRSFAANPQIVRDVEDCAAKYGMTFSEVLRRCVYFGLPMVSAEQVSILKSRIANMHDVDDVMTEKRLITQRIRAHADQALHSVMED